MRPPCMCADGGGNAPLPRKATDNITTCNENRPNISLEHRYLFLIQFKCTRYSRNDLTLSARIGSVSILFQRFIDYLLLLYNSFICWR